MAGSAEEYEKMALASMRRASESGGDPRFHHARAQIFATLAAAAASQVAEGRRRRVTRVAGLVVLGLLAVGVGVGEALTPGTEHVLLVGDSIMRQTGPALTRQLGDEYTVHNEGVNGSGLLTPRFFDWADQLEQDLVRTDPDVVVMLFIGNYTDDPAEFWTTPEGEVIRSVGAPHFAREWGRQVDAAMAAIAETGARSCSCSRRPWSPPSCRRSSTGYGPSTSGSRPTGPSSPWPTPPMPSAARTVSGWPSSRLATAASAPCGSPTPSTSPSTANACWPGRSSRDRRAPPPGTDRRSPRSAGYAG